MLGDIQDLLVLHIPGQAAVDKQCKIQLLRSCFNAGWTEMEEVMPLDRLRAGLEALQQLTTPKSRCRMHGGAPGSGAPRGERNGRYRHGYWTQEAVAERRMLRAWIRSTRGLSAAE